MAVRGVPAAHSFVYLCLSSRQPGVRPDAVQSPNLTGCFAGVSVWTCTLLLTGRLWGCRLLLPLLPPCLGCRAALRSHVWNGLGCVPHKYALKPCPIESSVRKGCVPGNSLLPVD